MTELVKYRAEMKASFNDRVLEGKLVDYNSIDSYKSVISEGAFDDDVQSGKTYNLDYRHNVYDVLATFKTEKREDGIYITAKPKDEQSYQRMKEEVAAGAGLSVMFEPTEATEGDGITFYKKARLVGGALTPQPSNKNAVVTYFREKNTEKENKNMTIDTQLMEEVLKLRAENEMLKTRSAAPVNPELAEVTNLAKELLKSRETEKIVGVEALKVATPEAEEWLKTREAEVKYMEASLSNDPLEHWKETLKARSITGVPAPTGILKKIHDIVNDRNSILAYIRHENLPTLTVGGDKALSKGEGHTAGANKHESEIQLETRVLTPQYVYKYIKLPKLVMNKNASEIAGALLTYVLNRLPQMVIFAVNRAIIMGDVTGVSKTQIYPVVGDSWAKNVGEKNTVIELIEALSVATPKAYDSSLVISRADWSAVRFTKDKNGRERFLGLSDAELANHFGFERVLITTAVDPGTIVSLDGYVTNGSRGMEFEEGRILVENNKEYLFEMPISGSLEYKEMAAYGTVKKSVSGDV